MFSELYLKYGYFNFMLEILEYINFPNNISDKEKSQIILEREQHHMDKIRPDYNTKAGFPLGYKATFKTKKSYKYSYQKA